MKKIFLTIILCMIMSVCFAGQNRPAPEGKGTYAELDGDNVNTGDNEFNGQFGGTGPHDWLGAARHRKENRSPKSNDFTDDTYWAKIDSTVTQKAGYQTVLQTVTGTSFLAQIPDPGPGVAGKAYTAIAKVKPTSVDGLRLYFQGSSGGVTNGFETNALPVDRWTTIRIQSIVSVDETKYFFRNVDSIDDFSMDFEFVSFHETLEYGLYSNNDSTGEYALQYGPGFRPTYAQTYTMQYAEKYKIEVWQRSTAGDTLAEISVETIADLEGKKVPAVFLGGGQNTVAAAGSDPSSNMFDNATAMVTAAKLSSDVIVLWTSPVIDSFIGTSRETWTNTYNAAITAEYLYDTKVTVLDINTVLSLPDDYYTDGAHPNIQGHTKQLAAIEAAIQLPTYAETYEHPVNDLTVPIVDENTSFETERISTSRDFQKLDLTADTVLTESQIINYKYISNQGDDGEADIMLPVVSYAIEVIFIVEEAQVIEINPPSGEFLDLNGVPLDVDDVVDSPTGIGAKMSCIRMQNASGVWHWSLDTVRGTWADGGPTD